MSGEHPLLARMRNTQAGWKDDQIIAVLEYYGYQYQRDARHGPFYRHPEIADHHPDLETRMEYAYFEVPRGEVKEYKVRNLLAAVEVVVALRRGST